MRIFEIGGFAVLMVAAVIAQGAAAGNVTCNKLGNQTHCSDGSTVTRQGNFAYDEKGNSWRKMGNFTHGSDGTTYNRIGNFTFDNKGNSYNRIGNYTFGSDGSSCNEIGDQVHCNAGPREGDGDTSDLVKPGLIEPE